MGLPLALPLAPGLGPGAAAAATLIGGGLANAAKQLYGFRTPLPPLPRVDGKAGAGTLGKLLADAAAGARIPVALPPNPLGPKGSLGGLVLGALAGVLGRLAQNGWGYLNSGRGLAPGYGYDLGQDPAALDNLEVQLANPTGTYFRVAFGSHPGHWLMTHFGFGYVSHTISVSDTHMKWGARGIRADGSLGPYEQFPRALVTLNPFSIPKTTPIVVTAFYPDGSSALAEPDAWYQPSVVPPAPIPEAEPLPEEKPKPLAPPPLPLAPPVPDGVPVEPPPNPASPPGQRPGSPTTPAKAPPVPRPGLPVPWWTPANPPAPVFTPRPGANPAQQTGPDGGIVPQPAQPVPVTDPGSVIPWPGAAPIPGTSPAPAPTLQGIAQEVGRIERKIEMMMSPSAPGNLLDRFEELAGLLGPIWDALQSIDGGTTYTLDSPCEVDGEGKRLPAREVEAPGALSTLGLIVNRLDALAQLLQVHKDLKQPNCRGADVPVSGEFVTVNFEQID